MATSSPLGWTDYSEPYLCFGPLVTPQQVLSHDVVAGMDKYDARSQSSLTKFAKYVTEFLPFPNDDLGREGPVCPFTRTGLDKGLIRITAATPDGYDPEPIIRMMADMETVFREMGGATSKGSVYKAIVVVFPDLPEFGSGELIETVQKALKPQYVSEGLMIGEFYPDCTSSGLHNPNFHAQSGPVPSLAIRRMTVWDAPFMLGDRRYAESYVAQFGDEGLRRLRALLDRPRATATASEEPVARWVREQSLSEGAEAQG